MGTNYFNIVCQVHIARFVTRLPSWLPAQVLPVKAADEFTEFDESN